MQVLTFLQQLAKKFGCSSFNPLSHPHEFKVNSLTDDYAFSEGS